MVKAAKEAILVKTWAERGGSEEDSKAKEILTNAMDLEVCAFVYRQ